MASRSTQRSRWILFQFFVLFGASYALGVFFLHITVSLCKDKDQDPIVEDVSTASQQVTPPSTDNSNHTPLDSTPQLSSKVSPSHLLAASGVATVSKTLTLQLYLAATDNNHSSQHNPTLLDSGDITGLKMELFTFSSKHNSTSVGHVYLYPNSSSTVSDSR